jgi:hypothetical protein
MDTAGSQSILNKEMLLILVKYLDLRTRLGLRMTCKTLRAFLDQSFPIVSVCLANQNSYQTYKMEAIDKLLTEKSVPIQQPISSEEDDITRRLDLKLEFHRAFTGIFHKLKNLIIYFKETDTNNEVDVRLLSLLPNLTRLRMTRCELTHLDHRRVPFPSVRNLILISTNFPMLWACCPNLISLKCSITRFVDSMDLSSNDESFRRMRKLTLFDLRDFSADIERLLNKKFVNLVKLTCVFFKFKNLKPLRHIRSLKVLSLKSEELEDICENVFREPLIDLCRELRKRYEPTKLQLRINSTRFIDNEPFDLIALLEQNRRKKPERTRHELIRPISLNLNEISEIRVIAIERDANSAVSQIVFVSPNEPDRSFFMNDTLIRQEEIDRLPHLLPYITTFQIILKSWTLDGASRLVAYNLNFVHDFRFLTKLEFETYMGDCLLRNQLERELSQLVSFNHLLRELEFTTDMMTSDGMRRLRALFICLARNNWHIHYSCVFSNNYEEFQIHGEPQCPRNLIFTTFDF